MFFCNSLAFSMIQQMLAIWSLVTLLLWNPACTSVSSQFIYYWSLAWRILNITLLSSEISAIGWYLEHGISLLGDWNENWPFPVVWPLLDFQICWHIEHNTLTTSFFRIWNSSAGIPSPPVALFTVMLHKAQLTSHSRMSCSRWLTTIAVIWAIKTLLV